MSSVGDPVPLERFLDEAKPRIAAAIAAGRDGALEVAAYLLRHLGKEPAIAVQVEKFRDAIPPEAVLAPPAERARVVREARAVLDDVKARWVDAEAPPILAEIDGKLGEIRDHLDALAQPQIDGLATAAGRIDALYDETRGLETIEQRLAWPAGVAAVLFFVGIILLIWPALFEGKPLATHSPVVLGCLAAFPCLAVFYAARIKPRSRVDAQIDALNREFFLPNGGIYFPNGANGRCVVRVEWTPPEPELSLEDAPRDPRKDRDQRARDWN